MYEIDLNFINRSKAGNTTEVVIFQRNYATTFSRITEVAWKVIKYCGYDNHHPFTYQLGIDIRVCDSYGNFTEKRSAEPGQMYAVKNTFAGKKLYLKGNSPSAKEIQVVNSFTEGAINVMAYRGDKLLALKKGVVPGQKAVFDFEPAIFINVASEIEEGTLLNSAVISQENTEISLVGIESADIIMTGGGSGDKAEPYQFELANIVTSQN